MYRSVLPILAMAGFLLILASPPALAHAALRSAIPPIDGQVPQSPKQLVLNFSEAVEPSFSQVTIENAGHQPVTTAAPKAGATDAQLVVPLPPLPNGTYSVTWHAVATDTHRTQGRFRFTVGR